MKFLSAKNLLLALLLALPFERIPSWPVFGVSLRVSFFIGALLILVVLWQNWRSFWPNTLAKQALWAFLGVTMLSALLSPHRGRALEVVLFTIFVALLALAVAATAPSLNLTSARRALLVGAVMVALFCLYQFFGDLAGLPLQITGLKSAYSGQVFGFPRVQGASIEPLYLADFLLLPLGIMLAGEMGPVALGIITLFYTILLLTFSRGGIAAGLFLTVIILAWRWRQKQYKTSGKVVVALVVSLLITYGLFSYVIPALTHYRATKAPVLTVYTQHLGDYEVGNNSVDRAKTRQLAWRLFTKYPVLGAGPGTFGFFAHQQHPVFPNRQIVNNEPLELLAETGVIGFGLFLVFALVVVFGAIKAIWRSELNQRVAWMVGLLGFLVAAALQSWSFSTLYIVHIWVGIGLLMGLAGLNRPGSEAQV